MRRQAVLLLPICALLSHLEAAAAPARNLTFEQRVDAQEAIERVYYAHQVGATQSFDEVVPRALIEEKVRAYLKRSVALERHWDIRITGAMLAAEAERMARGSRMPERLRELHAALGHDPLLILECLVRPLVVDRLIHASFDHERPAGAPGTFDAWWLQAVPGLEETLATVAEALPASLTQPVAAPARGDESASMTGGSPASLYPGCAPSDAWVASGLDVPPQSRTGHTAVWTGTVMIVWGGTSGFEPLATGFAYNPATDTYSPIATTNAPSARSDHTAVAAGGRMIVWGGRTPAGVPLDTGAVYRVSTNTWGTVTMANAPSPRWGHTATWTGSRMIVWGGASPAPLDTGAMYELSTGAWTTIFAGNTPTGRSGHTAVWTGSELIVWGGTGAAGRLDSGASYAPFDATWTTLPTAVAPTARNEHSAVWAGDRMIIWGGMTDQGPVGSGASYSPFDLLWSPVSDAGAPSARSLHTAVFDGASMHVWGGGPAATPLDTGGSYDPMVDSWTPISAADAPSPRAGHAAVWTGSLMVIWGGSHGPSELGAGGRYDPSGGSWLSTVGTAPAGRRNAATVWTGNEMIVWGGDNGGVPLRDGGRYNPASDSWASVSSAGAPLGWSSQAGVVWTGSEMVMKDGRYNPVADAWAPVSTIAAPALLAGARAVWTGAVVVFWDGQRGGRYNPSTDTWRPVSGAGAPPYTSYLSAIWTGSQMIVWGGQPYGPPQPGTGGRYDPLSDTWMLTSTLGAPDDRSLHTAIWTGQRMFIWGGVRVDGDGPYNLYTGGLYDPASDSWQPVAPTGHSHSHNTAVWTGSRVLLWGGRGGPLFSQFNGYDWEYLYSNSGTLYDPATDTWAPTSTASAPEARASAASVWTGSSMLVWGGFTCDWATQSCRMLSTGGVYGFDPSADGDGDGFGVNCDCDDAAQTVHPGAAQICGDGLNNDCLDPSWPSPIGTNEADEDGDGATECGGDCDDMRMAVRPGGPQICDGLNNDCDDPQWPALPAGEVDQDGDGFPVCPGGPVDCDDADDALWSPPTEAFLEVGPYPIYLSWDPPGDLGGLAVLYDVLRSSSRSDFVNATSCVESDIPWTSTNDQDPSGPNEIYYFLVRTQNNCPGNNQSVGYRSDGTPRVGRSCP